MTSRILTTRNDGKQETGRKNYTPPRLRVFGPVGNLTQAGTGLGTEMGSVMGMGMGAGSRRP